MTMHEESRSPSFADDLHKVAMTFDAPNTEFLYGSAVTRGRAIKRRRAFQGAFGAVVALVAAGALGLALAGGTSGHAVPSASDSVARPTASAGPITGKYMLESFKALLPGDVKIDPADGSATLYGVSFAVYGTSGGWTASAYTAAKINGHNASVQLTVNRPPYVTTCAADGPVNLKHSCTTTPLGGGATLVEYWVPFGTEPEYDVYRNLPGGVDVHLSIIGDAAVGTRLLTMPQILALVTAPAWDRVLAALPPAIDCPGDIQPQNNGRGPNWICGKTGKIYPGGPAADTYTNLD